MSTNESDSWGHTPPSEEPSPNVPPSLDPAGLDAPSASDDVISFDLPAAPGTTRADADPYAQMSAPSVSSDSVPERASGSYFPPAYDPAANEPPAYEPPAYEPPSYEPPSYQATTGDPYAFSVSPDVGADATDPDRDDAEPVVSDPYSPQTHEWSAGDSYGAQPSPEPAATDPYAAQASYGAPTGDPYAQPQPGYGQPSAGGQQDYAQAAYGDPTAAQFGQPQPQQYPSAGSYQQPGYPLANPVAEPPVPHGTAVPRSADDLTWGSAAHWSPIVLGFVGPILTLTLKGNESQFVKQNSNESLNFALTMLIGYVVSFVLMFLLIGFVLFPILWVMDLIFRIMGAVAASKGQVYQYPFAIKFLK